MAEESSLGKVPVALSPRDRFVEYLQSRSMRVTQQRLALVDHVFSHHEHFDADQLMEQLPSSGQPGHVSRPTVYRTLGEFVDAGLLRKFVLNGRAVYEHDYGYPQHEHLYCLKCHKVIEFQLPDMEEKLQEVCREHQFQLEGHSLILRGVCAECNKARITKRRLDLV